MPVPDAVESRCLRRLAEWPLDLSSPLFESYSTMKVGVLESVRDYVDRLEPLAEATLAAHPEATDWALTAPAFHRLPAAANLLCRDLHARLASRWTAGRVSLVELRRRESEMVLANEQDFRDYHQYSRYTHEQRVASRRKLHFDADPASFQGRGVLFVNDINVTGAQQASVAEVLRPLTEGPLVWLYIFDCAPELGRAHPELESLLNERRWTSLDALAAALDRDDLEPTAKCITKLMSLSPADLAALLRLVGPEARRRLWSALVAEGLYDGELFREKVEVLRASVGATKAM